uniref:Uncharacterized protein n=1 Tax=Compsopogon caeruleus TaxID=31354 RepID=A0A7S1TAN8_9RHOD
MGMVKEPSNYGVVLVMLEGGGWVPGILVSSTAVLTNREGGEKGIMVQHTANATCVNLIEDMRFMFYESGENHLFLRFFELSQGFEHVNISGNTTKKWDRVQFYSHRTLLETPKILPAGPYNPANFPQVELNSTKEEFSVLYEKDTSNLVGFPVNWCSNCSMKIFILIPPFKSEINDAINGFTNQSTTNTNCPKGCGQSSSCMDRAVVSPNSSGLPPQNTGLNNLSDEGSRSPSPIPSTSSSSFPTGAIAGIVISCVVALVAIGILFFVLIRRNHSRDHQHYEESRENDPDDAIEPRTLSELEPGTDLSSVLDGSIILHEPEEPFKHQDILEPPTPDVRSLEPSVVGSSAALGAGIGPYCLEEYRPIPRNLDGPPSMTFPSFGIFDGKAQRFPDRPRTEQDNQFIDRF